MKILKESMSGKIRTNCPSCGYLNKVDVIFPSFNKGFLDTEYTCQNCGEHLTVTDPHKYSEDGIIIEEEMDLETAQQEYSSAATSINSSKLPAIFKMISPKEGSLGLDYGGGKFDNASEYLATKGIKHLVYDPYNRSSQHNDQVISEIKKNGGADYITCSNVLNVIKEPQVRETVIKNIFKLLKGSGEAYFTVYEGSGSGDEGPTKAGYQLNKKTVDYVDEIKKIFPNVTRKGKLIIAKK